MRVGQPTLVLHSSDNYARIDFKLSCRTLDFGGRPQTAKVLRLRGWNQKLRREPIRLALLLLIETVEPFDEEQFLAVFQQVGDFMEKAEPKLIIALVAQAKRKQRFVRSEPTRGAMDWATRGCRNEHNRDAVSGTRILESGYEYNRIVLRGERAKRAQR